MDTKQLITAEDWDNINIKFKSLPDTSSTKRTWTMARHRYSSGSCFASVDGDGEYEEEPVGSEPRHSRDGETSETMSQLDRDLSN